MMVQPLGEPLSLTLADLQLPVPLQKDYLFFTAINRTAGIADLSDLQKVINDFSLKDDVCFHMVLDCMMKRWPAASPTSSINP